MAEIITGRIVEWNEDGSILIRAAVPSIDRAIHRQYSKVLIELSDGRRISPDQRRKIYALFREVSDFTGYTPTEAKEALKLDFIVNHMESICKKMFSLSNCSMTQAHDFIGFLIDFCIEHSIPTRLPLVEQVEDIARFVYSSAMHKKCVVCGQPAEVHHMSGSRAGHGGNNWREKPQNGVMFLPLCRLHHIEIHNGEKAFCESYHLEPIPMTREIGKVYGAGKKAFDEA